MSNRSYFRSVSRIYLRFRNSSLEATEKREIKLRVGLCAVFITIALL